METCIERAVDTSIEFSCEGKFGKGLIIPSTSDVIASLGTRALIIFEGRVSALRGFAPLSPGRPEHISFMSTTHPAPEHALLNSVSSMILVPPNLVGDEQVAALVGERWVVSVDRPRLEFARLSMLLFPEESDNHVEGVHGSVVVGEGTVVGPGVTIGSDVVIGKNCVIGPNVVIERRCQIGDRVVIGPGCCIGRAGFGFERDEVGIPIRLPHYAAVTIGDGVEIGANTVIDRGVFDNTLIEDCVKIDSQVLIGHNCRVGKGSYVIGGAVLCGGVQVGEASWIAPGAVVKEKVLVGDEAMVGIGSAVFRDVAPGGEVMGYPARPTLKSGSPDRQ